MEEMNNWQKSSARRAPKTKPELQQMLAEAARNTQLSKDEGPKRPVQEIPVEVPGID